MAALQEIARLLRPGGKALIYVWAMEQEYQKKKSKYLRENKSNQGRQEISSDPSAQELFVEPVPDMGHQDSACSVPSVNDFQKGRCHSREVGNSTLPIHTNRTSFHSQDLLVPWHLKGNTSKEKPTEPFGPVLHRYYHVFCEGELEAACQTLNNVSILQSYYDQGNWCVILQKV